MTTVANMTPSNDVNLTGPMALPDAKHRWMTDAEHGIAALATRSRRTGQTFTSDDLREITGAPAHGSWFGSAFAAAKQRGEIEVVAFRAARSSSRNGGVLRVWRAA